MAGQNSDVAVILTAVLAQIKKLTDEQLESLAAGTGEFRYVPKAISKQFTQLTKLTDQQLQQLASGEATYALVPPGHKVTKTPPPKTAPPTSAEIRSKLLSASDQHDARDYLEGLKLKPAELKSIAIELSVPEKGTAKAIIDTLIKVFVSGRLTTSAVRF